MSDQGHTLTLHIYNLQPTSLQITNFVHLKIFYIYARQYLKDNISTERSNQDYTMTLHNYIPKPCSYQVSTPHTSRFLRYSPDKIFEVKVTTGSQRPHQGNTMMLHTYAPNQGCYTLTVSDLGSGQDYCSHHPPAQPDLMGEENTLKTLKDCGVKDI